MFLDPPRVNQYFPIQEFLDPLGQVVWFTKSKSILSYPGVSGSARPGCWIHQVQVAAAVGVYVGEGEESPTEPGLPTGSCRVDATDGRQMSATRGSCGGHPAGGGRRILPRRTGGRYHDCELWPLGVVDQGYNATLNITKRVKGQTSTLKMAIMFLLNRREGG